MSADKFRLDGQVALITGAGTGLGRHFARTLANAGASVVLAARRADKLEETAEIVRSAGGTAVCVSLDVTDGDSVQACFEDFESQVGVATIVVNNAGVVRSAALMETSEDDWDAVLDTNLKGVFLVGKSGAASMAKAGQGGRIINIASILGFRPAKAVGPYSAAKSAVVMLTKTMALEMARFNIRVNAIAPGYFQTDMNENFLRTEPGKVMLRDITMRRVGEMDELSGPLLLLASDAGSYITGETIAVDGGHLISSL